MELRGVTARAIKNQHCRATLDSGTQGSHCKGHNSSARSPASRARPPARRARPPARGQAVAPQHLVVELRGVTPRQSKQKYAKRRKLLYFACASLTQKGRKMAIFSFCHNVEGASLKEDFSSQQKLQAQGGRVIDLPALRAPATSDRIFQQQLTLSAVPAFSGRSCNGRGPSQLVPRALQDSNSELALWAQLRTQTRYLWKFKEDGKPELWSVDKQHFDSTTKQ